MNMRVQEYYYDNGAFHKHCIHGDLPECLYVNTNNDSPRRRLVILQPDNWYGENLPDHVRTWDEMNKLVRDAEKRDRKAAQKCI